MTKISYAVALTFPGDIEEVFKKLREKYNKYISYKIIPHITLVYPFTPTLNITVLYEKLEEVARRTKKFIIVLEGIEYFEVKVNVAYIAVRNTRTVKNLHTEIYNSLKGLIKVEAIFEDYDHEEFVPHMTISDEIPYDVFPTIKRELKNYKYK